MLTIREAKYVYVSGYLGNSQLSTQFCYKPKIALKISLLEVFFFFFFFKDYSTSPFLLAGETTGSRTEHFPICDI